jgi:hypothetical protein
MIVKIVETNSGYFMNGRNLLMFLVNEVLGLQQCSGLENYFLDHWLFSSIITIHAVQIGQAVQYVVQTVGTPLTDYTLL